MINSILEYGDRMSIVSIDPCNLLIIEDFKIVRLIEESNHGNKQKCWISLVPNFDTADFPFLICSGSQSYNIINVLTGHSEPLIHASTKAMFA